MKNQVNIFIPPTFEVVYLSIDSIIVTSGDNVSNEGMEEW